MNRYSNWIKWCIILLAVCGLMWLFNEIGWSKLIFHFQLVGFKGFIILLLVFLIEASLDALALRVAILDKAPFHTVLFANQMGALLNNFAPGDSGELLKISLLRKQTSGRAISGTVVWNVAFRLSKSILILMAAALAYLFLPVYANESSLMVGLGCVGILLYIAISWVIHKRWVGKIINLLVHLPLVKKERINSFILRSREVEHEISDFRSHHPQRYLMILALQMLARLTNIVVVILTLRFLGADYGIPLCLLIYAGLQLLSYLLPLFPTRIGTTEGASYLLFIQLGLNGGVGAIFQILIRILQLTLTGVCVTAFFFQIFLENRADRAAQQSFIMSRIALATGWTFLNKRLKIDAD